MHDLQSSMCFTATGVMKNEILLTIFSQRSVIFPFEKTAPSAGPHSMIPNHV
jgi:hypothetical protein